MNIAWMSVYSEADRDARPVLEADEAYFLGPSPANQSYISLERVVASAEHTGAQAIHPGYGFLSENVEFGGSARGAASSSWAPEWSTSRPSR
jgi:acetyl/propionyl-CoA carboxylase alpha subunit